MSIRREKFHSSHWSIAEALVGTASCHALHENYDVALAAYEEACAINPSLNLEESIRECRAQKEVLCDPEPEPEPEREWM